MSKIAFIVEGDKTEKTIIKNLLDNYMNSNNFEEFDIEEIILPVGTNIYTLYKKMKEYDFFEDVDIINIVQDIFKNRNSNKNDDYNKVKEYKKDTFGEIYLFFDYDRHANDVENHDEIINDMLNIFDNETENGKLFISYPMIEAIKDISNEICDDLNKCTVKIEEFSKYKKIVSDRSRKTDFRKYDENTWKFIIQNFIFKSNCLFDNYDNINYNFYLNNINPKNIFEKQYIKFVISKKSVMILSAIPEFIIDYLGEKVFNELISDDIFSNIIKCVE